MNAPFESLPWHHMANYHVSPHSKSEIVAAGKRIASRPAYGPETIEAFRIAHSWRSAYAYPMHRMRLELAGIVRRGGGKGVTAGRLKRMQSIRRKLLTQRRTLYQIQDIGGCRAILPSMDDVRRVYSIYAGGDSRHTLNREDNYIEKPKKDGYRSRHLIFKMNFSDETSYNRQFIEVQLRTKLQHAWATAVETVGLARGENLKAGEGSPEWLRFFKLISAEFTREEGEPIGDHVPPNRDTRMRELRRLGDELKVLEVLEDYNQAIQYADFNFAQNSHYYLIQYNVGEGEVSVAAYERFIVGTEAYADRENLNIGTNAVLVEVDKVKDLRAAYPNYFMDVGFFQSKVKSIVYGMTGAALDNLDVSWIRDYLGGR